MNRREVWKTGYDGVKFPLTILIETLSSLALLSCFLSPAQCSEVTETVEEDVCQTVVRRECSVSVQQICRTEECTTQYQTVCHNQLSAANKGRTFGNIGISGNLGGGLGFGTIRRPGVSGNVDAGININTGSLSLNNNRNAGAEQRPGCRSVPKKSCRKLTGEQCTTKTGSAPQCRDIPSRECRKVSRPVKRQQCETVPKCVSVPRTQCKPVQR